MNIYEVIRRPMATEKTYGMRDEGKYVFEIHDDATKIEVKQAVEALFEVTVEQVNVLSVPAKRRRAGRRWIVSRPAQRKAVVKLAEGQSIRALESV